jgi:hypothetical protein
LSQDQVSGETGKTTPASRSDASAICHIARRGWFRLIYRLLALLAIAAGARLNCAIWRSCSTSAPHGVAAHPNLRRDGAI